jgi:hypothetical protein
MRKTIRVLLLPPKQKPLLKTPFMPLPKPLLKPLPLLKPPAKLMLPPLLPPLPKLEWETHPQNITL